MQHCSVAWMDELLGIPQEELEGLAESLEQAPADDQHREEPTRVQPPPAALPLESQERLEAAGGMKGLCANVVGIDVGVVVRDTGAAGLAVFTTRPFACGEVLFTERPQLVVASAGSCHHCGGA